MKKHISLFNSIVLIACLSLPVLGIARNGEDIDKKKTISKSYTVTKEDKLEIENSFGNVVINTWDKNEIKVDVEIGAKANTEEKAQDMLDEIEVSNHQSGHTISFKTDVGDINNHGKHNKNNDDDRKFYIDYTVYMPAANPLQIENSFGKIKVPNINGQVSLTSKFGGLTAGKLVDVDEIDVEFGTAEIGSVHNGEVTFKFNSRSVIDQVSGSVKIKSEFSGDVQFAVSDNIVELSVFESYSTVRMSVGKGLSANFDVHTSFGSFHNSTGYNISEEKDDDDSGPKFDKDYSGKAGDGKAKIKIKSSFGKVRLSDASDKTSVNSSDDDGDDDDNNDKHHKKEKVKVGA
jgi:hypothetical protein